MRVKQPDGSMESIDSKDINGMNSNSEMITDETINKTLDENISLEKYNSNLLKIEDKEYLDSFELTNNSILFRPFKLLAEKSSSGLTISEKKEKFLNKESVKMSYKDLEFPYQTKGVIVKMSEAAEEYSKGKYGVGSVVTFPFRTLAMYPTMLFKLNKNKWQMSDDEDMLTLITSVTSIETYEPRN